MGNSCVTGASNQSNEPGEHGKDGACQGQSPAPSQSNTVSMAIEPDQSNEPGEHGKDGACQGQSPAPSQSNTVSMAIEPGQSNEGETTFKWRINSFSSLLDKGEGLTTSEMFEISGFRWYLKLNPRDTKSGNENEYVSLRLALSITSVTSDSVVGATFKFWIYDQLNGKHHEEHQVSHEFQSASRCYGTSCIVPLAALKDEPSGFLVNNSCVFGVELIKAVAAKANVVSEVLFVEKIKNICSGPQAYTWNIEDFFALKSRSNSPEFELCGRKW